MPRLIHSPSRKTTGGHRCAAVVSMGSRVSTVKREGFHSVHARVSNSKQESIPEVLEGLG